MFWMIALLAMFGPIPPWPRSPWHLAQTPLNSCAPRSDGPGFLRARLSGQPAVEFAGGNRLDGRGHRRVLDPAELGALALVRPQLLDFVPGVVRMARDRVDLPAQRGDPPAVDHVVLGRGHLDAYRAVDRRAHRVDRDHAVRVRDLPVELLALDVHPQLRAGGSGCGNVLDARELVEGEDRDRDQDQDGYRRPGKLQIQVAADLRALGVPRPAPPSVLDDEEHEGDFDDEEDEDGEAHDEPVDRLDPGAVRRVRSRGSEASVVAERDARQRESGDEQTGEDEEPGAHGWHSTKRWPNAPSSTCHRRSVSLSKSS